MKVSSSHANMCVAKLKLGSGGSVQHVLMSPHISVYFKTLIYVGNCFSYEKFAQILLERSPSFTLCINRFSLLSSINMLPKSLLSVFSSLALVTAQAQGPAPPASTLSTTQSGVLPSPTGIPFTGVETIEGAITYDGLVVDGFTGVFLPISHKLGFD
jgi:hypothetical protein